MTIYAYTVKVDGVTKAGEVDANDERDARRRARYHHRSDGVSVEVGMVFQPPQRRGLASPPPRLPLPRVNYRRELYEQQIRKEYATKPVHR